MKVILTRDVPKVGKDGEIVTVADGYAHNYLFPRQLALVAKGKSNREISETVFLAEGTVKNYVSRIMEKLHVESRTELAIKALKRKKL